MSCERNELWVASKAKDAIALWYLIPTDDPDNFRGYFPEFVAQLDLDEAQAEKDGEGTGDEESGGEVPEEND